MKTYDIIDPLKISTDDLPLIVLVDNMQNFISWGIKGHTQGNYNHIMTMTEPGFFDSQDFMYRRVPIKKYLKKQYRLKFWGFKYTFSNAKRYIFIDRVSEELKENLFKRNYDYLGVLIGQMFNCKWFNNPFKKYCSERVGDQLAKIEVPIPKHSSPVDINEIFKKLPYMRVVGYWFTD